MNEIEKLYENAKIKPYIYCSKPRLDCDARETGNCKQDCEYYSGKRLLTPFTAEKQLELIKWLAKTGDVCRIDATVKNKWFVENEVGYSKCFAKFEEALANAINIIWEYMSEEEKEQIRSVLK